MAELELWVVKVLCLVIIFVVITTCTALPIALSGWFYQRGEKGLMALRVARCFGGGAFLGAFLLHVLPEVNHLLAHALEGKDIHYPVAQIIVGGGFFFIMIAEKMVHSCISSSQSEEPESLEMKSQQAHDNHAGPQGSYTHHASSSGRDRSRSSTAGELQATVKERTLSDGKPPEYEYATHNAQSHAHSHNIPGGAGSPLLKSVVLLFALSLDCVMEGMALGLQANDSGAWNMLIAILSHEFIIGFTLGLQLLKNNSKARVFLLAIFYGATCPFGIAIGTTIAEVSQSQGDFELISGIFMGITGGVFIYVTFFEILADEISSDVPWKCIISTLLGFTLMALLMLVPHEHEHDHDHDDHDHDDHFHVSTADPVTMIPAIQSIVQLLSAKLISS